MEELKGDTGEKKVIVVAFDTEDSSDQALYSAATQTYSENDEFHIVHVQKVKTGTLGTDVIEIDQDNKQRPTYSFNVGLVSSEALSCLDKAAEASKKHKIENFKKFVILEEHDVAHTLCKYVHSVLIDTLGFQKSQIVLVIGKRKDQDNSGFSLMKKKRISTSDFCVSNCVCAVMVIKPEGFEGPQEHYIAPSDDDSGREERIVPKEPEPDKSFAEKTKEAIGMGKGDSPGQ